ncbi:MAG: aldehyde ferredoxin oxidoreductase family protein [Candidatus Firestonebacteria bacterium]
MNGWMGKGIKVDLTSDEIKNFNIEESLLKEYLGGRGLGARILYDGLKKGINPLSPENLLIFSNGPLTGTAVPTSKSNLSTKSPLTGTILDCQSGGVWGVKLKKCGFDVLIIKGKSKKPIYIKIDNDLVTIEDASFLWGKDTFETTDILLDKEGKDFSVVCIGPAGENLVRFSCVINDKERVFGRGGPGAVMGSKNLKAILVKGDKPINISDKESLNSFLYEANKNLKAHPITSKALPQYGTAVLVNLMNVFGMFPTNNFQFGEFKGASKISGEAISEKLLEKKASGCFGCGIIQCARKIKTKSFKGSGPEYETTWSLGANCGIDDIELISEMNRLCNMLGMDTISTGGTIACAMELTGKGIIDFGIRFGEKKKIKNTIKNIAFRKGIGNELAEGSKRLSEKYKAIKYSMQVKGLELPAYDPRGSVGMGLTYATSNRGACHLRGGYVVGAEVLGVPRRIDRFLTTGKAGHVVRLQDFGAAVDSLVVCRFTTFALSEQSWARMLSAVTGLDFAPEDLMRTGERIYNLERLFNLREGFSDKDDNLPERFLKEPFQEGGSKGHVVNLKDMLKEYYQFRKWDEKGIPKEEKLKDLNLPR